MDKRFTAVYVNMVQGKLEIYGLFDTKEDAQYYIDKYGLKKGEPGINRGDPRLWEVLEIRIADTERVVSGD